MAARGPGFTVVSGAGPLAGIKVVDLSVMISGPLAAMMLADQGAEVIKVESPGIGDMMRFLGSQKNGMTGIFALHNRGKRSIGINLKSDAGRDVLRRLVSDADVVIQNYRPGALEKLGFGYDDVQAVNPGVVYVSISGFGPDGPRSGQRVYDNVIQAASGLASVQTDRATGRPQIFRTLVCDKVTSYTVAQAVTAALFARERGNGGQHVQVSMLDAAIAFMWPDSAMDAALLDSDVARTPTIGENYAALQLKDGFVTVSAVSQPEFEGYVRALNGEHLLDDPRFADTASRSANVEAMRAEIKKLTDAITVEEFLRNAVVHDVPASGINTLHDVHEEPQVVHNGTFVVRDHPVAGRLREARNAPRFAGTPTEVPGPAPDRGEHTDEIITSLGLDPAALRESGAVF
ncbi:MAG: CaiB/BaiF CoA transferase family protein [Acidimicrobiales bacterium]